MRDLIVSVAIVAVLIGGWLFFDSYSARSVDEMSDFIYSDYCLAKADKYVNAEDVSNSSGELNSLAGQMLFLKTKEKITPENIL